MRPVALIGFGAIGASIARDWMARPPHGLALAAVCVRPHQLAEAAGILTDDVRIFTMIDDLVALAPALVIETAGHAVVRDYGEQILRLGNDLCIVSVGALADPGLRVRLIAAARSGGGSIEIPAGALAGFDGLMALARHGIDEVRYISTKPCRAWKGTPAESAYRLDELSGPTTIFRGSAAEAAEQYPRNANLAAAVALAGIGFERTRIELIADPAATGNHARIEALGPASSLCVDVSGNANPDNPKSSAIVGASVVAALQNRMAAIQFI